MKLFWWRQSEASRNLGDEIGPFILRNRFNAEITRSSRFHCDAIGTGSILNWVYENRDSRATEARLKVLGSGLMYPHVDLDEVPYLDIYGVRGYLTRSCVSRTDNVSIGIGDPGLLISDLLPRSKETPEFQLGILPHVGYKDHPSIAARIREAKSNGIRVKYLDIETDDFAGFFEQFQSCSMILSQSLHGLIFADSLGIPNIWWDDRLLNSKGGRFKFYDYFSSINRPFGLKLTNDHPIDSQSLRELSFSSDARILELVRRDIRDYHNKALSESL